MTTTLFSTSPFPSPPSFTSTPREDSASCVCTLSELIAQFSDKSVEVRFQCLAYTRRGNSFEYFRCPNSSQHFGASHPDLYKHTTQVLRKDIVTPFEYSCFVVRTLFCDTHCKSTNFNKYYERIQANWKGDGNGEEQSLLNAIRCAFKLQASSHSAAPMPGLSSLPLRNHLEIESAASASCPQRPPMIQYSFTPTGTTKSGENAKSLSRLVPTPAPSIELEPRRLFPPSVQSRHTRSQSNPPQNIEDQQGTRGSDWVQSNSLQNTPSQKPPSPLQSQGAEPSRAVPALGSAIQLSFRDVPVYATSNGTARRQSNPPQPSFIFGDPQVAATKFGHQASTTGTKATEDPISSSSPPKTSFDFSWPTSKLQLSLSGASTAQPNSSTSSAVASILDTSGATDTGRPSLNGHPKAATVPVIERSSALAQTFSLSTPPMLDNDLPHDVISRTNTLSEIAVNSISAWFSPTAWNGFSNWDAFLKPVGTVGTRLRPQKIPQRHISKDDTCLDQIARSVDAAAPPLFNAHMEDRISAPNPAGSVHQILGPVTIDYNIRRAIQQNVTKEGHVYILKAPKYFQQNFPNEPPLVKIGISTNVSSRMDSLKKECGLFDLARVEDFEDRPLMLHWKIEELVHTELSNFNRIFKCTKCKGKKGGETQHHEWFAVTEEVALRTVQRWRKFIQQEPYDENGVIKDCWSWKIRARNMPTPKPEEKWDDSNGRDERWTKWLEDGVPRTLSPILSA